MTERDQLAAEYALGLLEGEDLLAARGRMANEPDFAAQVAFWESRLAPLLDEIGGAVPDEALWQRIAAEIETAPGGEVVSLQARLRFWQRAAAGAAMAAVGSVALLVLQPAPGPAEPALPGPLVASIPIGDTPLRLGVTYLPDRQEMLISASGLTADGVHDHELWLVPPQGELRSLGVVRPGREASMALDPDLADLIQDGAQMVLTREPLGGKPVGQAAGPVVAQGAFRTVG
ncbi:MAG: anti-sigma factor [Sphingomonadaceae bacterium]|nr:anti-sigma factor [Sphingomonadaceae bacterium]